MWGIHRTITLPMLSPIDGVVGGGGLDIDLTVDHIHTTCLFLEGFTAELWFLCLQN